MRNLLIEKKKKIKTCREEIVQKLKIQENLLNLKQDISETKTNFWQTAQANVENSKEFPMHDDVLGAVKGMVVLYYSYNYNITDMVLNGVLSYVDHLDIQRRLPAYEKFDFVDLENCANMAIDSQDYAIAIDFTRSIYELMPKVKITFDKKVFLKRIKKIKNDLIKLNNGYLEKRQIFVGKLKFSLDESIHQN